MKKKSMIKLSALTMALSSGMAMAADKPSGVDSFIDGLDKNLSITSNYVWRGQTASIGAPAVQGGATYNHDSGVSVDFWLSSSAASVVTNEYDVTVSYAQKTKDFGFEAGIISYSYPQVDGGGFHEFFGGVNVKNMNAYLYIGKDSGDDDNTYIELSADISRFNIALGVNSNDLDAKSYNQITATVGLTKDLSLGVSQSDLDGDDTQWALTYNVPLK